MLKGLIESVTTNPVLRQLPNSGGPGDGFFDGQLRRLVSAVAEPVPDSVKARQAKRARADNAVSGDENRETYRESSPSIAESPKSSQSESVARESTTSGVGGPAAETRMLPRPDVGFDFDDDQALGRAQKTAAAMPSITEVSADELRTAAGRLDAMLQSNSPLMRRARTQGLQIGNQRGLLNSSMAVGAAQGAMLDRAEPYALSDSANLTADARQNAAAQNERSMLQASMLGDSYLSNQDFQQRYGMASQLVQEEGDQAMRQSYGSSVANAWGVMGNNINRIVAQAMTDINDIQNNPNIDAGDKTRMIEQIQAARDVDVAFQSDLFEQFPQVLQDTGVFPPSEARR